MKTYEIKVSIDAGPAVVYDRSFRDNLSVADHVEHIAVYGVWIDDYMLYPAHRVSSIEVTEVE